jgi:membrane-associated phospholipid phosphatase
MKMRNIIIIIILFILFYESTVFAQNKYTFSQFGRETVDFIKQPLNWDCNDYLKMGVVIAGDGLIMYAADQPIRDAVLRDQRYFYSVPIVSGRVYGELYSPIIFFSGFALYSLITDDMWSRKVAYEIGQASLYAGGINYLLKVAVGRARPNLNLGAGTYRPFSSLFVENFHSMPGGHTTAAFTISTVLSRNVKPVWLKVLFYVPAALTFVSRVYQDKHWTSDDFMGAAFGYYIATWVVDKHDTPVKSDIKDSSQSLRERIQLSPFLMGDIYGVNFCIRLN